MDGKSSSLVEAPAPEEQNVYSFPVPDGAPPSGVESKLKAPKHIALRWSALAINGYGWTYHAATPRVKNDTLFVTRAMYATTDLVHLRSTTSFGGRNVRDLDVRSVSGGPRTTIQQQEEQTGCGADWEIAVFGWGHRGNYRIDFNSAQSLGI